MLGVQHTAYSGISFQQQIYFEDGHQDVFYLTLPSPSGPGYLAQYPNKSSNAIIVIDRLKITIDPADTSQNYLYFLLLNPDGATIAGSMAIPMQELIVGNPNFTNISFQVKPGYTVQIAFSPSISTGTLLETVQYRVRVLDALRTKS
jgi:hypothetical protein